MRALPAMKMAGLIEAPLMGGLRSGHDNLPAMKMAGLIEARFDRRMVLNA